MRLSRIYLFNLVFIFLLGSFSAYASEGIAGVWHHASKPAQIAFNLETGIAFVKLHDGNRQAEGLTLIRDISTSEKQSSTWVGRMYNGYLNDWVPVSIHHANENELVIYNAENKEVLRLLRK